MYLCSGSKTTCLLLFVTVTNVLTCRESMNITDIYVSVLDYFIIRYSQCRQRYKYFRFGQPYCYFQLSVVLVVIWGHFLWTRHGRKPQIHSRNFDAIYHSSRDISTSGLNGHIATVAAAVLKMTRYDIEFTVTFCVLSQGWRAGWVSEWVGFNVPLNTL